MLAVGPWTTAEGGLLKIQRGMEELGIWKKGFAKRMRAIPGDVAKVRNGVVCHTQCMIYVVFCRSGAVRRVTFSSLTNVYSLSIDTFSASLFPFPPPTTM